MNPVLHARHVRRRAILTGGLLVVAAVVVIAVGCRVGQRPHQRRPVVIIGWDGASWDILDPLLVEGRLPTLQGLLDRGSGGLLLSTPSYVSPPAWVSLYSGKNPGKTNVFHFGSRLDDLPHLGDLSRDDVRTARLWEIMGAARRRCAVINVPLTYPAWPMEGVCIAGEFSPCVLAPDTLIDVTEWEVLPAPGQPGRATVMMRETPVELIVDVFRRPPRMTVRHVRPEDWEKATTLEHLQWSDWLPVRVGGEVGSARFRLQSAGAADIRLWLSPIYREIERFPEPIAYPTAWADTLRVRHQRFLPFVRWHWEPALEHLQWFEDVCADVQSRERWDLFTCVFLAPDHMQHLYGDGDETTRILEELDRITGHLLASAPDDALIMLVSDHGFAEFSRRVDVNRWLADLGMTRLGADGAVQPESSLAWSTMWSIYLNERRLSAADREGVIERLLQAAPHAVDPDNGNSLGLDLIRREEVYQGPFLGEAPHLLVTTTGKGYIPEFWDHKNAAAERLLCQDTTRHTAWDHAPTGILVAAGPGIRHDERRVNLSVYDIVPTVLAWAGLPVGRDMDGRVILELFEPGKTPDVTWYDTHDRMVPDAPASRERGSLEDRLRALGYIKEP